MDTVIGMHEAKSTLSELVQRAAAGETILIGPRGQALVKLTSLTSQRAEPIAKPLRRIGILKGKLKIPANFDDPLPDDLLDLFDGGFEGGFKGVVPGTPIAAPASKLTGAKRSALRTKPPAAKTKAART